MAFPKEPRLGFPLVLSRAADDGCDEAAVVRIRAGTTEASGFAAVKNATILKNLHLNKIASHARFFMDDTFSNEDWSISEEYKDRPDLLKGASGQLAALLALLGSDADHTAPYPGALRAGVIWVTGSFQNEKNRRGVLKGVVESDFSIKLKGFLDSTSALFIAPDRNWRWLEAQELGTPSRALVDRMTALWTVDELRRRILDTSFSWDAARDGRRKYGVRVGLHDTRQLLDAFYENLPRPPQLSGEAYAVFGAKSRALEWGPFDEGRIHELAELAHELRDWQSVLSQLMNVLDSRRRNEPSEIVPVALGLAEAMGSAGMGPHLVERLLNFAEAADPSSDSVQRATIDHYRATGATGPLLSRLLTRSRSIDVALRERLELLEEAGRRATDGQSPGLAREAWAALLALDPNRPDIANLVAAQFASPEDAPSENWFSDLPDGPPRILASIAVASDGRRSHKLRWQALHTAVSIAARVRVLLPATEVLPLALALQPTPKALIELVAPVAPLRDALLEHYCRTASAAGDQTMMVRFLRIFIDVTGELGVAMDALTRHHSSGLRLRLATEVALDATLREELRQLALEQVLDQALAMGPKAPGGGAVRLRDVLQELASVPAPRPLVNAALARLRATNEHALRRDLLRTVLQADPADPGRVLLLIELGELEERLGRLPEAFASYREAVQLGAATVDLAGHIDRTVERGTSSIANAEDPLLAIRPLLQWDPSLSQVRRVFEQLVEARQDWHSLLSSKRYRLECEVGAARIPLLWEMAVLFQDRLHSPTGAISWCEEILKLDQRHAAANELLSRLRPRARLVGARPSSQASTPALPPNQLAATEIRARSGADSRPHQPARVRGSDVQPLVSRTRTDLAPTSSAAKRSPSTAGPGQEAQTAQAGSGATAGTLQAKESPALGATPRERPADEVPGALTWKDTALAILELSNERREEVLRRTVERARARGALQPLQIAFRTCCADADPALYRRFLELMGPVTSPSRSTSTEPNPTRTRAERSPSTTRQAIGAASAKPIVKKSAETWIGKVDALKALSPASTWRAVETLVNLAHGEGEAEELARAFHARCAVTHASLYLDFQLIVERLSKKATRLPSPARQAIPALPARQECEGPVDGDQVRELSRLIKAGNVATDPRTASGHFLHAADIALSVLRDFPRAAMLYQHAYARRDSRNTLPPYRDVDGRSSPDESTWAALREVAQVQPMNHELSVRERMRRIALVLRNDAKDETAFARIHIRIASFSMTEEESLWDLIDVFKSRKVFTALQAESADQPLFIEVVGRMVKLCDVDRHRSHPEGALSARVLNFAGMLSELRGSHAQAMADLGWAMVADPSQAESRARLRAAARRASDLPQLRDFYYHAVLDHPQSGERRHLLLELAVIHLAAGELDDAERVIDSIKPAANEDESTRRIISAVRATAPLLGPRAWSLLAE
ncbi:MAG: hypothetical protein JWM10_747 [Myxococcaceae bacterium]|nr:hypothetical protein [Myxococcaceae bacterium]